MYKFEDIEVGVQLFKIIIGHISIPFPPILYRSV